MRCFFIFLIISFCVGVANAVTKCVALDTSTVSCSSVWYGSNVSDWEVRCNSNGIVTAVKGIVGCSDVAGSARGVSADVLSMNADSENVYCWCRIISPVVSKWVYSGYNLDIEEGWGGCGGDCAIYCREPEFVKMVLSNLM